MKSPTINFVAMIATVTLGLNSCSDEAATNLTADTRATQPDTAPTKTVELGAASLVPSDVSYFSSVTGLGVLIDTLASSQAFQQIANLPTLRRVFIRLAMSDMVRELRMARAANPLVKAAMELASSAYREEMFLCGGAEWAPFLETVSVLYATAMRESFEAGLLQARRRPSGSEMIAAILEHKEALRIPSVMFGFKVADPNAARDLLTKIHRELNDTLPAPTSRLEAGGGVFHTMELSPNLIPGWQQQLATVMRRMGIAAPQIREMRDHLSSQTLALAVGVRDQHVILSLGSSNKHLHRLGQQPSLARSAPLQALARYHKPGRLSLTYISTAARNSTQPRFEQMFLGLGELISSRPLGETAGDPWKPLRHDLERLGRELDAGGKYTEPLVSASFRNRGIETFTIGASTNTPSDQRRLELLQRAGSRLSAAFAARPAPSAATYGRFAHWVGVGFKHFENIAVPMMRGRDRMEFRRFRTAAVPFATEFDTITRELFLPAVDGQESLLTFDDAEIQIHPGAPTLRYPRPAFVWELADPIKFLTACSRYRRTINEFLAHFGGASRQSNAPQIPAPDQRVFAGGTMFSYRLPAVVPDGIEPHVVLVGNRLVASLSPQQSKNLIKDPNTSPRVDTVDVTAPSASLAWIDLERLADVLEKDAEAIIGASGMRRRERRAVAQHVDAIIGAFRTLKSFSHRIFHDGKQGVVHSWLQVKAP